MRYLNKNAATPDCVFCEKLAGTDDVDNLVVWRGRSIAIVMNLYPYTTGHLMLMPYEHVASPEDLDDPLVLNELAQELPISMRAIRSVLHCQGFNTGMNTGHVAGAGIADHMHMHLVPRWSGDANFMPLVANVTVMPEALSITYAKLRAELIVEHREYELPRAMVFSHDRTAVFARGADDDPLLSIPRELNRSLTSTMHDAIGAMGIDAVLAGWTANDIVVWQATNNSIPTGGEWKSLSELPAQIRVLADDALARLPSRDS